METILQKITEFADSAHGGQQRKYTPERYIVHPIRVMAICRDYTTELPVLAAALLHDVLEDTPVTPDELLEFLRTVMDPGPAIKTLHLVKELTDVYIKAAYPQWNRKKRKAMETERIVKTSAMAQTIKYADILDNSKEIAEHDPSFGPKFLQECHDLLQRANQGNPELHRRALTAVKKGLGQLAGNKEARQAGGYDS